MSDELRRELIETALAMNASGINQGTSGNLSVRHQDGMLITPSGMKYETLDPSIVNPIAMVLTTCMMLDHIGETDTATQIRSAVEAVVAEGKVRTYDMMRLTGRQEVLEQGACATTQMTDAIIGRL